MDTIALVVFMVIGAGLNRLRGWGAFPDGVPLTYLQEILKGMKSKIIAIPCYFGIAAGIYSGDLWLGVIVACGYQLWAIPGWGDYWDGSDRPNHEVGWIDDIFDDVDEGWKRDLYSMSVRGLLGLPTFLAISAFYAGDAWLAPFYGLLLALQGLIYHGCRLFLPTVDWVHKAELIMGALWCYAIAQAVP